MSMPETTEPPAAHGPCEGDRVSDKPGMITHHVSGSGIGVREHSKEEIRAAIYAAEVILSDDRYRIEMIPPEHMFVPGLYFRRFEMAEGTYLTGKLHANDDGLIVAQGKVTFHTENGSVTMDGPCMTMVKANTKPFLYAHTHVVFFSAHLNPDDTQDIELIESRVIIHNALGCQNESREVLR